MNYVEASALWKIQPYSHSIVSIVGQHFIEAAFHPNGISPNAHKVGISPNDFQWKEHPKSDMSPIQYHTMKNTYCLFQIKFITEYQNVQHIIITQI